MKRMLIASAAALIAGCHYRPTPVPVAGDPPWIASLAGTWTGIYQGTESGRAGSITFTMRASGDSAFGDVMMDASESRVFQPVDDPVQHRAHANSARLLAIRFVEVAGGRIEGALEPYIAPDCDCTVTTTFSGAVRADTIRGTFITQGRMLNRQTGVWSVTRSKVSK
jgi:hypothetical protein